VQHVEVLALVFMNALDLDVVECSRIDDHASAFADAAGQHLLADPFHPAPAVLECRIVGMRLELLEPRRIGHPTIAYDLVQQPRKLRIAQQHEAAQGNAVGHVVETFRP
jgi:hypothetical protein